VSAENILSLTSLHFKNISDHQHDDLRPRGPIRRADFWSQTWCLVACIQLAGTILGERTEKKGVQWRQRVQQSEDALMRLPRHIVQARNTPQSSTRYRHLDITLNPYTDTASPTTKGDQKTMAETQTFDTIPILPLSHALDPDKKPKFLSDLRHALLNVGFLYLSETGLPDQLISDVIRECQKFFRELPEEEKEKIEMKNQKSFLGWSRVS
jgi:hypothetical protein